MLGRKGYITVMAGFRLFPAIGAAALMGLAATSAHAESKKADLDFTVRETPAIAPQGVKSLQWDARKGRWGLTLNMDQPSTREMQLNDVAAGAYFRITPSLRIGGAVALSDKPVTQTFKQTQPVEPQPRVRLETAFKF
jgi:hypothetical protein